MASTPRKPPGGTPKTPKMPTAGSNATPPAPTTQSIRTSQTDPHKLAEMVVEKAIYKLMGTTIHFHRGEWWRWNEGNYRIVKKDVLLIELNQLIKQLVNKHGLGTWKMDRSGNMTVTLAPVTQSLTSDVRLALAGHEKVYVDADVSMPIWLGEAPTRSYIALNNGLYNLQLKDISPPTPQWFSSTRLPVDYAPKAIAPKWEAFLGQMLEGDQDKLNLLQEWFGYNLVFDTAYQSLLMLVGPGANGKSVITSILSALLGAENVSNVTLEAFSKQFDLSATVGKLANIVSEVGFLGKVNEATLKSFVGGDDMSFDKKYSDITSYKPTARITIATNNLPKVNDPSNGFWRRIMIMDMPVIITEDKMDRTLTEKLKTELPGILNWAFIGLARLTENGKFTLPAKNVLALEDYKSISNPLKEWMEEEIELVTDPHELVTRSVASSTLYESYRLWCIRNGYKPLDKSHLGAMLKGHSPNITQARAGHGKVRVWKGLRLLGGTGEEEE